MTRASGQSGPTRKSEAPLGFVIGIHAPIIVIPFLVNPS